MLRLQRVHGFDLNDLNLLDFLKWLSVLCLVRCLS